MQGKKIVIAIDGSPASDAAVAAGLELASALGSKVHFVHAASPLAEDVHERRQDRFLGPTDDELLGSDSVLAAAAGRATRTNIEYEVELIGEVRGKSAEVRQAGLAAEIAGIADGLGAGLIVVGSRGRGIVTGAVFGSVSQALTRLSTVPVLVVRPDEGGQLPHPTDVGFAPVSD